MTAHAKGLYGSASRAFSTASITDIASISHNKPNSPNNVAIENPIATLAGTNFPDVLDMTAPLCLYLEAVFIWTSHSTIADSTSYYPTITIPSDIEPNRRNHIFA